MPLYLPVLLAGLLVRRTPPPRCGQPLACASEPAVSQGRTQAAPAVDVSSANSNVEFYSSTALQSALYISTAMQRSMHTLYILYTLRLRRRLPDVRRRYHTEIRSMDASSKASSKPPFVLYLSKR